MKKQLLIFLIFMIWSYATKAQDNCACCDEKHEQFDFWVGNWYVLDVEGNRVGENKISKIEGNCILLEQWKGAKGTTGTSHNYFDRSDATWNQLWIDNKGNVLKLKGHLKDGKMVLKGDLKKGKEQGVYDQITWSQNQDGTVSQLWEVLDKNDKRVKTLFLGIYHRKD